MESQRLTKKEKRALAKKRKRQQRQKQVIYSRLKNIFTAAFGIFFIAFFGFKFINWIRTPTPEVAGETTQVSDNDWIKGESYASVTLIEYSDFQCSACAIYSSLLKQLSEEYVDSLLIVYRHFPLNAIHKNAVPAAKAAESAGKQGKFWEMHDMLFDNQNEWAEEKDPKDKFVKYAKDLRLDENTFKNDFESQEIKDAVSNDLLSANNLELNATPTFFLNCNEIQPKSYQELKNLIEKEIEKDN